MTLTELRAYVSYLVDDLDQTYFTPVQLNRFLNEGLRQCQKKLIQSGNNWYLRRATRSLVANQQDYKLPCDFLKLNRIEIVTNPGINETSYSLSSITTNQQGGFAKYSQNPVVFFLEKDLLMLVPIPQLVNTMRLYYTYRVEEMVLDADEPDAPIEYHDYIALLAALECFIKDGRDASLLLAKKNEIEKALDQDAIERIQNHASMVVMTDDDGGGGGGMGWGY